MYAGRNSRRVNGKRRRIFMHRVILERKLGHPIPEGLCADHINRDGLDNRRDNLRPATNSQNVANSEYGGRKVASPYRGVSPTRNGRRWRARIQAEGKQFRLGTFDTPEEAALAYNAAAIQHYGEFARLNAIEDVRNV